MVSISIRRLTRRFGDSVALDDVSLEIGAGEMFFLLGPSGCGKTTLLRHIAGFLEPDEGTILFDGSDVTRVPAHRRNTAMMFQSYALWPHMTVAENVAFGLQERRRPRTEIAVRVQEALQMVRMGHLADRGIHQLSGGQQQRVALARAIVVRPAALLLDEPLSNLDAKLRLEMRGEIRRICRESGVTAVYVTHDQQEALHLADRIAVMERGAISQAGTPVEIYRSPRSAGVAAFIGEANFLSGTLLGTADGRGYREVETEHGVIAGRITDPSWEPPAGGTVQIAIRPESLRLTDGSPGPNRITGRIAEVIYLGDSVQYVVCDEAGRLFRASEFNPGALREAVGAPCAAGAQPDDVMILRP